MNGYTDKFGIPKDLIQVNKGFNNQKDRLLINGTRYDTIGFKPIKSSSHTGDFIVTKSIKKSSHYEFSKKHIPTVYEKAAQAMISEQHKDRYINQLIENNEGNQFYAPASNAIIKNMRRPMILPHKKHLETHLNVKIEEKKQKKTRGPGKKTVMKALEITQSMPLVPVKSPNSDIKKYEALQNKVLDDSL